MKFIVKLIASISLLATSTVASSATVLIDFDDAVSGTSLNGFYSGGTDSASNSGPDLGVTFSGWDVTAEFFGQTSSPNFIYGTGTSALITTTFGFTRVSFTQGAFEEGSVSIYSTVDPAGTALATFVLSGDPFDFELLDSGPLAALGRSLLFTSTNPEKLGIDDLTFTTVDTTPVPLPAAAWLLLSGLAGLGYVARRKVSA